MGFWSDLIDGVLGKDIYQPKPEVDINNDSLFERTYSLQNIVDYTPFHHPSCKCEYKKSIHHADCYSCKSLIAFEEKLIKPIYLKERE